LRVNAHSARAPEKQIIINSWEAIFKKKGKVFYKPHESVVELIKLFNRNGVKRVLDLGCGSGRHTVYLAKQGFDVHGLDNSKSGLKMARRWLDELKLKGHLVNSSCYSQFPFKDDFFDAIISVQVIHHARLKDILKCISEIFRVLKPGGYVFVTVTKNRMKGRASKVKVIGERTYVMLDGPEKGIPHYIYTQSLLRKYFSRFEMIKIHEDKHEHYCLLGRKPF